MKYSLFRVKDLLEAIAIYLISFCSNSIFTYVKTMNFGSSSILRSFIKDITDYQIVINILLTFIMVVFHYQFLTRKKTEIFCRILVGDTIRSIIIRYIWNSLLILLVSFLLSFILNFYLNQDITTNLYLVYIFIIYILISVGQVQKNENLKIFYN